MDQFSYLSVLLSIILGLAITQVLKGFRGILLTRARLRLYWPSLAWGFALLLIFVQSWWAMFSMREIPVWTFPAFSVVLLQTILSYMLAAIVFPDFFGEQTIDLREHYYTHARWFFGLMVGVLLVSVCKDSVLGGPSMDPVNLIFHIVFISTSLAAALTRREWYHKIISVAVIALFSAYIMLLFVKLR
jgi:hypothetical protein